MQLGEKVEIPASPEDAIIDAVRNKYGAGLYVARFVVHEFTSLCPVTGQPDFAKFIIDYIPDDLLIESKSLKLFLGSFRNHKDFHEHCTTHIGERLFMAAGPHYMRIAAYWRVRGGISIDVFWEKGHANGITLPDNSVHMLERQS